MKQSHWAAYNEELGGPIFLEKPWGFCSYAMIEGGIWIKDIYIVPEERRKGRGKDLIREIEDIARAAGKTFLIAEAQMNSPVRLDSIKAQIAVGFVPGAADNGVLYSRKEIK